MQQSAVKDWTGGDGQVDFYFYVIDLEHRDQARVALCSQTMEGGAPNPWVQIMGDWSDPANQWSGQPYLVSFGRASRRVDDFMFSPMCSALVDEPGFELFISMMLATRMPQGRWRTGIGGMISAGAMPMVERLCLQLHDNGLGNSPARPS